MSDDWDGARYEREKRNFVESRLRLRSVYLHTALIFTITWLIGWLTSWLLLQFGVRSMPLRYGLSFFVSYFAFIACVRIWADMVRAERGKPWDGGIDFPTVDGEGCAVVLIGLALGLLAAALFALLGGLPLLLEVAFELAFAGVIVRRLSGRRALGDWLGALVRNTWLHALATLLVLIALAAWLQYRAPGAVTFAAAVKMVWAGGSR